MKSLCTALPSAFVCVINCHNEDPVFIIFYQFDSINMDVKFSLKAVINRQKTKVMFAEIDRDFADVLFSFLTMPLGKIVRVLKKHYGDETPVIGSLTTLYGSLSNLDEALFWAEGWKQVLLNPASSFSDECRKLKLDIADTQPTKYFICEDKCPKSKYVGMYHDTVKCDCGKQMKKEMSLNIASKEPAGADDDGVFAVSTSSFILSDGFEILPNSTASVRKIVNNLGLIDANGTECRILTFGLDEVMQLLLALFLFPFPLTRLILETQMTEIPVLFQMEKRESSAYIFNATVILQKSTTKLLFVEAEEDFVDFLFSMLVIPLGKVESLLGGKTCLTNIDNLYRSITSPIDSKYLKEIESTKLVNPTIPNGYVSRNCILPLVEKVTPKLYYYRYKHPDREFLSHFSNSMEVSTLLVPVTFHLVTLRKCEGSYVRGPRKFMVIDDLTVTPLSTSSYLSTINEQKIPFSDIDELRVKIGLQEALSIFKASLSSTCALSKGLNHILMKTPKQEKNVN